MRLGLGLGLFKAGAISAGVRIFSAFQTRVIGDGGTVEAGTCVVNGINGSALLQQASLLLIPSGNKGGKLYAEIPTNGNGDLTWTRGSDAFRTNASGLIQRVPWNLASYSEQFDNAYWTKRSSAITLNAVNAPNGTLTADLMYPSSTGNLRGVYANSTSMVAGASYTWSVYAKSSGKNWLYITCYTTTSEGAFFNLSTGVVGTVNSGVTATITNVGDGWYRCTATKTAVSSTTTGGPEFYVTDADNSQSVTASGTSGIYLWGAQLVEGTTAQTYLPTTDRLNFPRLSYMYGSCPSALLEPQRTNLCLWSNSFSNAVWQTSSLTVSDNNSTGIDGNQTACLVTTSATGNFLFQNITVLPNTTYTLTFYVKRGTMTDMKYRFRDVTNSNDIIPVTSYYSQTNSSTFTRISVTLTTPIGCVQLRFYPFSDTGSIGTAFITQAQCEQGAYSSTIIPTTSATATRVADSFSRNNIYTNGLISAAGGTWFVGLRGNVAYVRDSSSGFGIGDSSSLGTNSIFLRLDQLTSARLAIIKRIAGIPYTLYTTTTDTTKIAIKWNGTSADIFVNGVKEISATAFTTTNMDFLAVGSAVGVGVPVFIQQMALFPTPLTDAQCQTLTTL
jgi:hypothetical protein